MTPQLIDQMAPGLAMDELLATEVMGWEKLERPYPRWVRPGDTATIYSADNGGVGHWMPSRRPDHAFEVADNLRGRGLFLVLNDVHGGQWRAAFLRGDADFFGCLHSPDPAVFAWMPTMAGAISSAALKAVAAL